MEFPSPLRRGTLLRRYKRFLADVRLEDGSEATVHCPNPGSMLGVAPPGAPAWVSVSANRNRKLAMTLELVEVDGGLVAINTNNPNRIAAEAITEGRIPSLSPAAGLRREVKYGANSRIDILLESDGAPPTYVEVKNVHMMRSPGLAEFPDSVTARGAKHLRELSDVRAGGARSVMLFVVQRMDCERLRPAADLDPAYAAALRNAVDAGVETLCYDCEITTAAATLRRPLPIEL
ncbi:MAG: DNA/RNA nuclease SfsA [Alphaproteobacteria bacterium]|nr:DNA/RNA nuclease SfsA [Alphaproteobacteria bacterium]